MRKKPILLAIVALLTLAGLATAFYLLTRPPLRFIYGIMPIGPDEAALLTRHNGDDVARSFIEVVKSNGDRVWEAEVTPLQPTESLGYSGLTADPARVYVLGESGPDIVVAALDRKDGRELWRQTVAFGVPQGRIGPMLKADGPRLIVLHNLPNPKSTNDSGYNEAITALDAATGARLWPTDESARLATSANLEATLIAPERLITSGLAPALEGRDLADSGVELDTTTGERRRLLPIFWRHWPTPAGVLGLALGGLYLIPPSPDDPTEPRRLIPAEVFRYSNFLAPAGVFEDLAIIGLAPGTQADDNINDRVLLGVELTTGTIRWLLEFKGSHRFGDFISPDGDLPRMLPVVTLRTDTVTPDANALAYTITVVDLKTGTRISEQTHKDHTRVFATSTRAVVHNQAQNTLVAYDPATGAPLPFVRASDSFAMELTPDDLRYGQLWYHFSGWAHPGDLPWTVIDMASWKVLHENGR